ncbi:PREDICTED: A-kinase anchor protein 4-like [Tinamus guttatus]|uniref:A-kinase anchor protein 4-like n=1 Tax=Tinamus guttatus TaxID=94827 RepID=UPI00052EA333|nr:PREDICTED: A-kinase anchor protein 4-like [Tinamus guttatus]
MASQSSSKQEEKQISHQGKKSDDSSGSKALTVSAMVSVASDMMFSLLETMQVQKKEGKKVPACVFLKKVLLEHTKEVISDLIDSTMKNLHSVTGVLMKDTDFISTLNKNLFNVGSLKAAEILDAMVRRLLRDLSDDRGPAASQSLAFTALKARSQSDVKSQGMRISAMKGEMHNLGKDRDRGASTSHSSEKYSEKHSSMDKYAKDLITTALKLIKQYLLHQTNGNSSEYGGSSFGYVHRDTHLENAGTCHSSKSLAAYSRSDLHDQSGFQKGDLASSFLSLIQKLICEAGSSMDESSSETHRSSNKYGNASESQKQVSVGQPCSSMDQLDGLSQVNEQFIGQLVDSVMKLCQLMAQESAADLANGNFSDDHAAS